MGIGIWQLLIILIIILLVFGAGKLPKIMEDIGKGAKSLKKGLQDNDEANKQSKLKSSATDDISNKEKDQQNQQDK